MRYSLIFILLSLANLGLSQTLQIGYLNQKGLEPIVSHMADVFDEAQVKVEFFEIPPARSVIEANSGKTDGILLLVPEALPSYPSQENLVQLDYPTALGSVSVYSISKSERKASLELLSQKEVGILRELNAIRTFLSKSPMTLTEGSKIDHLFRMLMKKRIDYVVLPTAFAEKILESHERYASVRRLEPPITHLKGYTFLHKRHKLIMPRLNAVLKKRGPAQVK
ncbi:hypothetical protein [Pseudobacteriovorax antillogorgiicola]|uniref:Solute-binding protein family 3/N-terminal domain-containing protein n=1 Tax=Pseudobacteriovorax antillogorgiicola TaxID=1513793 RepID=A0A1Y6BKR8_9BACT|nr:hypothetical protein [Pseudobacteriovorax antillogorgiicola]TCS56387.1 hypothetical protein EDD56_104209 [Pseudobacteriovorax antillogorgiicola]SMF06277.1 hypothetical protein SAMN06296036_104124 [Pseudobacteriovorax antillogorgiicola]